MFQRAIAEPARGITRLIVARSKEPSYIRSGTALTPRIAGISSARTDPFESWRTIVLGERARDGTRSSRLGQIFARGKLTREPSLRLSGGGSFDPSSGLCVDDQVLHGASASIDELSVGAEHWPGVRAEKLMFGTRFL